MGVNNGFPDGGSGIWLAAEFANSPGGMGPWPVILYT